MQQSLFDEAAGGTSSSKVTRRIVHRRLRAVNDTGKQPCGERPRPHPHRETEDRSGSFAFAAA